MNILFSICGRAGSKGIKGKNLRQFMGVPLALYTLAAVQLLLEGDRRIHGDIALNTDSRELMDLFRGTGDGKVEIIDRPPELATDTASKFNVIKYSLDAMAEKKAIPYDYVVDLDITSPLRTVRDIQNAISEIQTGKFDVVFSVAPARRNPYFNMVKNVDGYYHKVIESDFTARQQAPEVYDMNASIYAYKPRFLRDCPGIFHGRCGISLMEDQGILDLDHERDFELMEVIADYLQKTNPEFRQVFEKARRLSGI